MGTAILTKQVPERSLSIFMNLVLQQMVAADVYMSLKVFGALTSRQDKIAKKVQDCRTLVFIDRE